MAKVSWLFKGGSGNGAADRLFDSRVEAVVAHHGGDLRVMTARVSRSPADDLSVFFRGEPSTFFRIPGASTHVGFFTWPADRLPAERNWDSDLRLMDEIWVPSNHDERVLRSSGYSGNVRRLEGFAPLAAASGEPSAFFPGSRGRRGLSAVRAENRLVFLSSVDEAFRQGLPLLLSEWLHFLSRSRTQDAVLLIRLAPDAFGPGRDARAEAIALAGDLGRSVGQADLRVGFLGGAADGDEFSAALGMASAFVGASLGESFDVSAAAAVERGLPAFLPNHSFYSDLVVPPHSVRLPVRVTTLGLCGPGERYPLSSEWGLIRSRSLSDAFAGFTGVS